MPPLLLTRDRITLGTLDDSGAIQGDGARASASISSSHQTTYGRRPTRPTEFGPPGRLYLGTVERELAPGVKLVVEGEAHPAIANVGTPRAPVWVIAPGIEREDGSMDESGAIPLVVMAAAKIAKKADPEKKAARKAKREKKRTERRARREARKAAGQPGLWDQILSLFSGKKAEAEPVPAQTSGLEYVGQDELGAILIDTDGRRVDTERW